MFTFGLSLVSILYGVILLSEKKLEVEANECYLNSDCTGFYKYCCKRNWYSRSVCRHNCIAQPCATNGDCGGPNECCRSNICTALGCGTPNECSSKHDCPHGKYCCKKWRTYYQSSVCRSSCTIGQSCDTDGDCGGPNECCDSSKRCTTYNCLNDVTKALASWVIGVIVVGVLIVVVIPVAIVICCCCGAGSASRRPAQRSAVLSQQATASTVDVPSQGFQNNPAQFQSWSLPPPYSIDKRGQDLQFPLALTAASLQSSQNVQNYPAQFQSPNSLPPPYSIDKGEYDQFQPPTAASTVDVPLQIQNNNTVRFQNPSLPPPYLTDPAQRSVSTATNSSTTS